MARLSIKGPGTVEETAELLRQEIPKADCGGGLVGSVSRPEAEMLVFDNYFFRVRSAVSISVLVAKDGDGVTVDILSTSTNVDIFGVTDGLEMELATAVFTVLESQGFEITEKNWTSSGDDDYTPPPADAAIPLELLMRRPRNSPEDEKETEDKYDFDEPERVTLGREEKKGLFGRKKNKPDWEY